MSKKNPHQFDPMTPEERRSAYQRTNGNDGSALSTTPAQRRREIKKANRAEGRALAAANHPPTEERPDRFASSYALAILRGLQNRHVYGGTVADAVKAQRRVATRAAGKARRSSRQRAA